MSRIKFTPLQIGVHLTAWALAIWLVWAYSTGNLTVNPIQDLTQRTGKIALIFLVSSLACTPINTVFGFKPALKVRRALGLYAFVFATSHGLILVGLDYGFDWFLLQLEILDKRYILVGLSAFLILLLLAITSFRWWMRRLGKYWKWLHRLVYLAGILVVLHYRLGEKRRSIYPTGRYFTTIHIWGDRINITCVPPSKGSPNDHRYTQAAATSMDLAIRWWNHQRLNSGVKKEGCACQLMRGSTQTPPPSAQLRKLFSNYHEQRNQPATQSG